MSNNEKYMFCDNAASLAIALPDLQSCTLLAFDCEGLDLGRKGGSLSLLSFRTMDPSLPPSQRKTYMFDVISLTPAALRPVYDVLESEKICKIVFDGRMDSSCLLHNHGVLMRNVLDIQLADVGSRAKRGEGDIQQLIRLGRVVNNRELQANRAQYLAIHRLLGLRQCAEEHGATIPPAGPIIDHATWLRRPLPAQSLTYAANDVLIIELIHAVFSKAGYYDNLSESCMRYVTIWSDAQPVKGDRYRMHPLLPLNILNAVEPGLAAAAPMVRCTGCMRFLPRKFFLAPSGVGRKKCFVCHVVESSNTGLGFSRKF